MGMDLDPIGPCWPVEGLELLLSWMRFGAEE